MCKEDNPDIDEVSQILACKVEVNIHDQVNFVLITCELFDTEQVYYIQSGLSPLWLASRNGHIDIAKMLLQEGAEVDSKDEVSQWLHCH